MTVGQSETSPMCVCGHTMHWHSHGGEGNCEHDGACECEQFEMNRGYECCGYPGGCSGPCATFPCWELAA